MKKALLLIWISLLCFLMNAPLAISAYSGPQGVNIHGFVSQGYLYSGEYNYLAHNSKDGSFEYDEMGINFASQLTDRLRVGVQLFARDLGDVANNKITLDWAYGDYRLTNWLGVRVGKIKRPLGFYNEIRDVDMLRTSIVMPQGIYNDLLRDNWIALNGAGIYGNIGLGPLGSADYQALSGSIYIDPENGPGKFIQSKFSAYGDGEVDGEIETRNAYCTALRWQTPLTGLRLGGSWYGGSFTIPVALLINPSLTVGIDIESQRFAQFYSLEYIWRDLVVTGEYFQANDKVTQFGNENTNNSEAYYLSVSYQFTDLFTLGVYYAESYVNMEDKEGEDETLFPVDHMAWEKDLALTLRFDINSYLVFKIEGHAVNGTANVMRIDNMDNDYDNEDWYYGASKVTISF